MASWPTLREVRSFLRAAQNDAEDLIIDAARLAAIDYGQSRLGADRYPEDTDTLPASIHYAAMQHSARLYRRRDSVDGTLSFGELGVVQVRRSDPDVAAAYDLKVGFVFG
jgi:hypothetical protein